MPIYLYRNLATGETFELEQRISEAALTKHPQTGDPVKRLIQPVGIAFKGSGFYVNDSRSKNSAASTRATKPGDSASGAGASSDSKSSGSKTSDSKASEVKKSEAPSASKSKSAS